MAATTATESERHAERATKLIPRGGTRSHHFHPATYLERGEGPYVWDLDGRRYLDCNTCFGSMILGHAHPAVTEALVEQARAGAALGAPGRGELALAEEIARRVPSAERIAFVNSGTEATTAALRIARAATGRRLVAKFEGGWHGWNDQFLFGFLNVGGPLDEPEVLPSGAGLTDDQRRQALVLPYNSDEAFGLIERNADEIAAVLVEGIQGAAGAIVGDEAWLHELRERCRAAGVLFICDEVITGFRVGPGGIGERLGLDPDMVTFGKICGGGLPIGVVGGKAEVMQTVAPPAPGVGPALFGTFSANAATMAAGLAQLQQLGDAEYAVLARRGEAVREGLRGVIAELGITACVTGVDSLWGLHFAREVRDVRALVTDPAPKRLAMQLGAELRQEGLFVHVPVHLGFVSTAHTDEHVEEIVDAHRRALARMAEHERNP
jgi:glutamate-1-semialdehyde 2,1-aminomutase